MIHKLWSSTAYRWAGVNHHLFLHSFRDGKRWHPTIAQCGATPSPIWGQDDPQELWQSSLAWSTRHYQTDWSFCHWFYRMHRWHHAEEFTKLTWAMLHNIHSIYPPPSVMGHLGGDPISEKKLDKLEGLWDSTVKEIIGWMLGGANYIISLL